MISDDLRGALEIVYRISRVPKDSEDLDSKQVNLIINTLLIANDDGCLEDLTVLCIEFTKNILERE